MTNSNDYTIDAEALRRTLQAIQREILDAEPVAALRRIDELLAALDVSHGVAHQATI